MSFQRLFCGPTLQSGARDADVLVMATILPESKSELLAFCQSHAPVWSADPSAIGLTAGEVAQLAAASAEAAATALASAAAQNAARAATHADNTAQAALHALAAGLISRIKFRAETSDDPAVYARAQIPAPQARSVTPPPAQPALLRAALEPAGGLTIRWKAANASGSGTVVYQVSRRLPGEATFTLVGLSGGRDKSFTDRTLPAGSPAVQYMVQGIRGTVHGAPSEILTVQFGVDSDGAIVSTSLKMAA